MAVWEQVKEEVTTPHISYAVTGFALVLFGTISLFLKEKLYIGEATVATIYGLIVGPHCLNWFTPTKWGNSDYITLEISRIVLIVQIFAVAVELPKKYMLRHWWSVSLLLLPVMTFGWIISSVFIWKLVPTLRWIDALCIAGCVTATDPVLASAVVGKGKFARRVPTHLRNLLSAESGCNDGMAFPFVIMAVYIELYEHHAAEIAKEFILVGVLYSCVLGCVIGAVIGYGSRHLIKFAERFNLIDRESFLVYYFCVALFCCGVGTLCGVDDLLVAFAAGSAFSWDGWFAKQTEESHVSNVIDVLLNTAFFVYFGAIVPWPDFNNYELGIKAWKLVCLAIIILVVRRLPIMLAIKPITPDIHTWREALFCGHFGPIGVGAIFMCLLARAQIETHSETPTPELPTRDNPHYFLVATIWPITCFLVISSIIVHGSSIAVFTLGKRINNMAITLTYTTSGNEPSWMSRLPRRSTDGGNVLQLQRLETEEPFTFRKTKNKRKLKRRPTLRRKSSTAGSSSEQQSEESKRNDQQRPQRLGEEHRHPDEQVDVKEEESHEGVTENLQRDFSPHARPDAPTVDVILHLDMVEKGHVERISKIDARRLDGIDFNEINIYREGSNIVVEDKEGNYIHTFNVGSDDDEISGKPHLEVKGPPLGHASEQVPGQGHEKGHEPHKVDDESRTETDTSLEKESSDISEPKNNLSQQRPRRRSVNRRRRSKSLVHTPSGARAHAYMIDNMVYVENEDGDILRRYKYVPRGGSPDEGGDKLQVMSKLRGMLPKFMRPSSNEPKDEKPFDDVENSPGPMLIPQLSKSGSFSETDISGKDEEAVRRRLSQMLETGQIDRCSTRCSSENLDRSAINLGSRSGTIHSQAITTDDESEINDEDDEDAEPETAIERHRRLAALGIVASENRDYEAESGLDPRNHANDGGEDEPKITFKLPERPRG